MIIKKLFKKTLAGTMLALMACASMNAMAEPEWKKVDDVLYYGTGGFPDLIPYIIHAGTSWEEICDTAVKESWIPGLSCISDGSNCTTFSGEVFYYSEWYHGVYCGGFFGAAVPENKVAYGVETRCEKGRVRPDGGNNLSYFGCWELVDCDPNAHPDEELPEACKEPDPCDPNNPDNLTNGKLPESCCNQIMRKRSATPEQIEACKPDPCDPKNYEDGILPATCCVPTGGVLNQSMPEVCKTQCPKDPPKDLEGNDALGAVTCGDVPCAWPTGVENDKAQEILNSCVLLHEKLHLANFDCYPTFCAKETGYKGSIPPYDWMSEVISYQVEAECLGLSLGDCNGSQDCESAISDEITRARINEDYYRKKICKHYFGNENCTDNDIGDRYKCVAREGNPKRKLD